MIDIVLDSNYFAELLAQYFDSNSANRGSGQFHQSRVFSRDLARCLNRITAATTFGISNLVVASTLAPIEVARSWDDIVQGKFSAQQMHAFINQHPDWFSLAPVDEDLIPFLVDLPSWVMVDYRLQPIEWTDAVHLATVVSRGPDATLATSDGRIKKVLELQGRILL